MKRSWRFVFGCLAVMVILLGTAGPASAHAQLESTSPAPSSVLLQSPSQVILHFGEPVEIDFGSLRVLGPSGQRIDNGGTHHPPGDSHAVAISLPKHLARGTYVVAWRVISADSHPVHGAFVFSIGSASGAAKANTLANALTNQSGSPVVGTLYWFIRFAAFAGLLFLVGLAFMTTVAWRPDGTTRRIGGVLWACWGVLLAATLLGIAVQGVYAADLPLTDIVRPSLIGAVLGTRFGRVEMLRVVVLLGYIPVLLGIQGPPGDGDRRWRWIVSAESALGIALLLTQGLAGHASTGSQPVLGLALDVVHLGAAAVWLGGLALLVTLLIGRRKSGDQPVDPVRVTLKVSTYAFLAVVVVVATGTIQAIRQVGSLYALLHTDYGQTLLVKIALVVLLIGVGAASRRIVHGGWGLRRRDRPTPDAVTDFALTAPPGRGAMSDTSGLESLPTTGPRDAADGRNALAVAERPAASDSEQDTSLGRLRRTVLAEIAIALAVLAVTALLVNAVPAKQAAELPFSTSFTTLGVQVNVIVSPARTGAGNQVHIYVLSGQGTPKAIPELDASLSLPVQNLGPLSVPLVIGGPGHYYATNVDIPVGGTWTLKITVRTDAIDEQVVSETLPVH